jgi:hypothetical protein
VVSAILLFCLKKIAKVYAPLKISENYQSEAESIISGPLSQTGLPVVGSSSIINTSSFVEAEDWVEKKVSNLVTNVLKLWEGQPNIKDANQYFKPFFPTLARLSNVALLKHR